MKRIIFFTSLLLLFLASCSEEKVIENIPNEAVDVESRNIPTCDWLMAPFLDYSKCDDCCVTFDVLLPDPLHFNYTYWQMHIEGAWGPINTASLGANTFEHCFDKEGGSFDLIIIFYDENFKSICKKEQTITVAPCEPPLNMICWEDFIGYFNCASSVELLLPDGTITTVEFNNLNCDDEWCIEAINEPCDPCPCPAEVPVEGGYCCIYSQIIASIESTGYTIDYLDVDIMGGDCFKGNDPLPAFIINSPVVVLAVNGTDCDGNLEGSVEFLNNNCE